MYNIWFMHIHHSSLFLWLCDWGGVIQTAFGLVHDIRTLGTLQMGEIRKEIGEEKQKI